MCCHRQRPREANLFVYFHCLPVGGELSVFLTLGFSFEDQFFFEKELMKTEMMVVSAET
jgi:hypothetical protein